MARLTPKDIRKLTLPERQKKLDDLYNELTNVRIQLSTGGGTENPHRTRSVRKAIARVKTVQREEEMGGRQ